MKRAIALSIGLLMTLMLVGTSWATGCFPPEECQEGYNDAQWVDFMGFNERMSNFEYFSWTHDITDDGFDVGTDKVLNASLALDFMFATGDWAYIKIEGIPTSIFPKYVGNDLVVQVNWLGENALENSGQLDVGIFALPGRFDCLKLVSSELTVNGCEPVPEPATMVLFGAGLVGLVGSNRLRKNKKE